MRPEMLEKLEKLIADGAVVLGPAPKHSPSLENQPQSDEYIKQTAAKIWGQVDGVNIKSGKYGKGLIFDNVSLEYVMSKIGCIPDCIIPEGIPLLYSHQTVDDSEIYFISNQGNEKLNTNISFRVKGLQPELWDPITGETRYLPEYTQNENCTKIPITLDRAQSFFIVFRKPIIKTSSKTKVNFPTIEALTTITNPWNVDFKSKVKHPKPIVLDALIDLSTSENEKIKYFSGKAVYKTSFDGFDIKRGELIRLNLNKVASMAKVKINGTYVGGVWTYPYTIDITKHINKDRNEIEIEVVNTWVNRMIGDLNLPEEERETKALFNPYNANSHLMESGLIGPVTLEKTIY